MYAKIQNNQVVEWPIINIRDRFPRVSLPEIITDQVLPEGYVIVHHDPQPEYSWLTHKLVPAEPVYKNNQWVQNYTILPLTSYEIELHEQIAVSKLESVTQEHLDNFAKTRGYSDILSAISYQTSSNAKYSAEANYAVVARDLTWTKFYELLADTNQNVLTLEYAEFLELLPQLAWPT
jgi:hypothetical protein